MPAAWIGAGAAAIGAVNSLSNSGGGSAGQAAQGVANTVGGALSAQNAIQFGNQLSQVANPFGQYNQQFGGQLANATQGGAYGNQNYFGQYLRSAFQNGQLGNTSLTTALDGAGIGQQLNGLVSDPDSFFNSKLYQSSFNQGQNAVNATLAAQGLNASGNQLAALQNYGQSFASNQYNQQLSNLSGLYGQALGANQQGYQQLMGLEQFGLNANQLSFNQLAEMSGLSSGSPAAAAAALSNIYGNVNSAGQSIGTGVGQLEGAAGNILNGLQVSTPSYSSGYDSTGSGYNSGLYGPNGYNYTPSSDYYSGSDTYGFGGSTGGNSWGFTE